MAGEYRWNQSYYVHQRELKLIIRMWRLWTRKRNSILFNILATLPSNSFFKPDLPLVPTTIKSIFSQSAWLTIVLTTDFFLVQEFLHLTVCSFLRLFLNFVHPFLHLSHDLYHFFQAVGRGYYNWRGRLFQRIYIKNVQDNQMCLVLFCKWCGIICCLIRWIWIDYCDYCDQYLGSVIYWYYS